MYLPRSLISQLYLQLQRTHHALSPPVLILVALEPDALCACRILASLLKRDYIPHKIHPVAGYGDLARAGQELVQPMRLAAGGSGGVVACLGVGGLVDLESVLGLEVDEDGNGGMDGVDIWVFDARRPWNLSNVFGGLNAPQQDTSAGPVTRKEPGVERGQISKSYRPGKGGIVVFDDGDIEAELASEREAWHALEDMPDLDDDEEEDVDSDDDEESSQQPRRIESPNRKRKSWSDGDEEDDGDESEKENRPQQRRRSNSSSPIPSTPSRINRRVNDLIRSTPPSNQLSSPPPIPQSPAEPTARQLRRRLLRLRRKHNATLRKYHSLGTSYSEPISSILYSLASELGREDNDTLWLCIVGVSSTDQSGRTSTGLSLTKYDPPTLFRGWASTRGARIRQTLRDEVRRLNPPELTETGREVTRGLATDVIPTHARSPTDTSIRLSPEPLFLLIRHWSLYDSMLHSPYLAAKLHLWTDAGRRRLHKLLAKMGVSLTQCKQSYTHMDMDLKKDLRRKLLSFAPIYGLDALVPPPSTGRGGDAEGWGFVRCWGWKACLSAADVAVVISAMLEIGPSASKFPTSNSNSRTANTTVETPSQTAEALTRFYAAYDALLSPTALTTSIPLAQTLHRAILRTGTGLLAKRQLRHLRAFRMAVVKEGPDVGIFVDPGALTKLALWIGGAVAEKEQEADSEEGNRKRKGGTPLVLACVDDARGVYVVVGLGGGSSGGGSVEREKQRKEKQARKEAKAKTREEKKEKKRQEREDCGEDEEGLESEEEDEDEDEDSSESESEDEEDETSRKRNLGRNRFGNAFQEVVEETNARVRLDSFEHCVVEVKKEDLSGFLESLSMKAVVG